MIFQSIPFLMAVFQITLIGFFAWLLNWTMRRRSAQTRHAIWITALAAIAVTLPSKWIVSPLEVSSDWLVRNAGVDGPIEPIRIGETESAPTLMGSSMTTEFGEQAFLETFHSAGVATPQNEFRVPTPMAQTSYRWSVLDGLILLYSLGFLVMVSRIVIAALRLRWMYRQGFDLSQALRQKVERAAAALSLARTPRIRICQAVRSPLAFGILRPTVLLPEAFCDWSEACQQSVLTHELVHVVRKDSIWDFLAQVTSAIYWFHPVVHWVALSQKRERELATDECVIAAGVDCIQYAIHLVDVLSEATPKSPLSGAMEMSHFGDTQSRLTSVLRMSSQHPKRSRVVSLLGVVVFFSLATTSFQLIAQSPSTPSLSSPSELQQERGSGVQSIADIPTVQRKAAEPKPLVDELPEDEGNFFDRITTAKLMQVRDPDNTYTISGTVVGADQKPAAGAIVAVRVLHAATVSIDLAYRPDELIARTKADESGRYRFDNVPGIAELGTVIRTWQVIAAQPNGDFGWGAIDHDFDSNTVPKTANISLRESTTISGVYTGPSGDPIPNATVSLNGLYNRHFRDGGSDHDLISLFYSSLGMQVKSDEQGRFKFAGVPQGWVASVFLIHDEWAMGNAFIRTSDAIKIGFRDPYGPKHFMNWEVRPSGSTIVATKGYLIKGVVRTSDGAPVGNCVVSAALQVGVPTNANGEFSYRVLSSDFLLTGKSRDVTLQVTPRDKPQGLLGAVITLTELKAASGEKLSIELQKGIPLVGKVLSE